MSSGAGGAPILATNILVLFIEYSSGLSCACPKLDRLLEGFLSIKVRIVYVGGEDILLS